MNEKRVSKNQNTINKIGKVSLNTLGKVPRPVFESYRSPGWFE